MMALDSLYSILSTFLNIKSIEKAITGQSAIAFIKEKNYDLVVLDLNLPDMNGLSVLKSIKKRRINTKVIVFTNYALPMYKKASLQYGADFFLDKTTDSKKFLGVVKSLLLIEPGSYTEIHQGI
jgi:DNA-binding response OmpR family regulator